MGHYHIADIQLEGLQDNCPDCNLAAQHPFTRLDDHMLTVLFQRSLDGREPRSITEGHAMTAVITPFRRVNQLSRRMAVDIPDQAVIATLTAMVRGEEDSPRHG